MPRFRLPRPIAAATLVLGALAVPQVAAAQSLPQLVQCAVGYSAGPEMVVLTAGTVERQALINDAGAACTDWIQSGNWIGVDRSAKWGDRFQLLCRIDFGPTESVDVYANPDYDSRVIGYGVCIDAEHNYRAVTYNT